MRNYGGTVLQHSQSIKLFTMFQSSSHERWMWKKIVLEKMKMVILPIKTLLILPHLLLCESIAPAPLFMQETYAQLFRVVFNTILRRGGSVLIA